MSENLLKSSSNDNRYASMVNKENRETCFKKNPFKATSLWNDIESTFKKDMPLKKHRAYLRYYEESFTGREAVDFMIEILPKILIKKKEISRQSCEQLLQLLMNKRLFYNVRNEMDFTFRDSLSIYKFNSHSSEQVIKVKRSSSVNENTLRRISLRGNEIKAVRLDEKSSTITKVPRPSLSHRDIPHIIDEELPIQQNTPNYSKNISKDDSKQSTPLCRSHSVTINSSSPSSVKVLKTFDASHRPTIRALEKKSTINNKFVMRTNREMNVENKERTFEEISSWKFCILSLLREYLDPRDLSYLLPSKIDDFHVAFNCEKVGSKGIVKCFSEDGEMSSHLLKMMRFLARYPFDTKKFVSSDYQYVGIELDIYHNIVAELRKMKTVLSNKFSLLLIEIFKIYTNEMYFDSNSNNGGSIMRKFGGTPLTKFMTKNTSKVLNSEVFTRNTKRSSFNSYESKKNRKPIPFPMFQNGKDIACTDNGNLSKTGVILPSHKQLRLSCDLTGIEEVSLPYFSPNTIKNLNSPYKIDNVVDDDILTDLFTYILLLLPSQTRRRFHIIIRFMNRISVNRCLKLSKYDTNRILILKEITPLLMCCLSDDDIKMNSKLIAFIMDKEDILFRIPDQLIRDRESYLHIPESAELIRRKISKPLPSKDIRLPGYENIIHSPVQYCEKIDVKDFDQQAKNSEQYLEDILNEYLTSKLFSNIEREKKLKEFKKWYPEIYKKHVSDDIEDVENQPPKTYRSFVKRVKNFVSRGPQSIDS
ncbi:DEP domain and Winged helix-turn-helix DNA-binding domain-containing protein [Strongyloides ratti]|uniref:DEP domain and Winged helix-turn-helix DNA-binding domain-containing protein n=1 Tax=Strongyloides ratti TaxID=34506 RepID=A0A090LF41_STRRB|nr:DEP domain and Winged helix-turn-helix DNA-binding domain-containing protein [Strongyloides ratti]CEF68387.1 DEP domain and Winged helix-turn-helix DNA-binding domain-containing protein [Strongyloides ratti]